MKFSKIVATAMYMITKIFKFIRSQQINFSQTQEKKRLILS